MWRHLLLVILIPMIAGCTCFGQIQSFEAQGLREYMEDRSLEFCVNRDIQGIAVFDGHGGDQVAQFLKEIIESSSQMLIEEYFPSWSSASSARNQVVVLSRYLVELCQRLDDQVESWARKTRTQHEGSTAVIALVTLNSIVMANIGDSRGLVVDLNRGLLWETRDHKPYHSEEKRRIQELGGFVRLGRVSGILAVSRSFGDLYLKPFVTAQPDLYAHFFKDKDSIVVLLATDGLWDVFQSKAISQSIQQFGNRTNFASSLIHAALKKGSTDNISVVMFHRLPLKND